MPRNKEKSNKTNKSYDWFANLAVSKPRCTHIINLFVNAVIGMIIGLGIAIAVYIFATFVDGRLWSYLFGIGVVFLLRIVGQYIWLEKLRSLVPKYARPMIEKRGLKYDDNTVVPVDLSGRFPFLVTVVVTTTIATILTTEDVTPDWMSELRHSMWITAVTGGLATILRSLASPSTLYTLLHNRTASSR